MLQTYCEYWIENAINVLVLNTYVHAFVGLCIEIYIVNYHLARFDFRSLSRPRKSNVIY
jgi:hypothetical protein